MAGKVESGFLTSPDEVEGFHWDVLRPLSDEEFTALKHGIAEDGIVSSIVLDKDGNILDGGHRLKAWKELLEEGHEIPQAPLQTRHDIGSDDGNAARLLARKLNMQRRQLTNLEKRNVIKQQLRETWLRSDTWIGEDLGVKGDTVKARRREMVEDQADPQIGDLPEKVEYRNGDWGTYKVPQRRPKHKPKTAGQDDAANQASSDANQTTVEEQIEATEPPKTVSEALENAINQIEAGGQAPADAPGWPTHPSQQTESEASKRIKQISAWMAGLSQFEPEDAADLVSAPADIDARIAVAEEVIDWFENYRDSLQEKRGQTTLRAV